MVYYFAFSIFLFHIVTVLGSQFWNDVDSLHNQLSDPQDMQAEPEPPAPQCSPSPNEMTEKRLKRRENLNRGFFQKYVTVSATEVETFKRTIITDKSYPQNISLEVMENKLLSLGRFHEWFDIDIYDIDQYPKYWGKVCISFWSKPLVSSHKYYCTLTPSYGTNLKKILQIGENKLYFDLLYCRCHNYETNHRFPLSAAEKFLIHKSGENEYYIFDNVNSTKDNRGSLVIKYFHGGITLPKPLYEEQHANKQSQEIFVTVGTDDIEIFNRSLGIAKSYPENISLAELDDKLMEFGEIHDWPDLKKYNLNTYSMYWANLCVSLWGKQLHRAHRQACILSTSFGTDRTRTLSLKGRTLHFDLLYCKCHSFLSNFKYPVSDIDIFLIHQSSANEFFVFEQRSAGDRSYTLFIKDFKQFSNLHKPAAFKGIF